LLITSSKSLNVDLAKHDRQLRMEAGPEASGEWMDNVAVLLQGPVPLTNIRSIAY
jgi:hypothetical protein